MKLKLGARTQDLVDACQVVCVPDCCGLDAYDFSPIYVSAHLSKWTGDILQDDITAIEDELQQLITASMEFEAGEHGFICSIEGLNQNFTEESLREFCDEVSLGMRLAEDVLRFATDLLKKHRENKTSHSTADSA